MFYNIRIYFILFILYWTHIHVNVCFYLLFHLNSSETIARCWYILLSGSVLMKDSMVLPPCRYVYICCLVHVAGKVNIIFIYFISYLKLFYVRCAFSLSRWYIFLNVFTCWYLEILGRNQLIFLISESVIFNFTPW